MKRFFAILIASAMLLTGNIVVLAADEIHINVNVEDTGRTLEPLGTKGAYVERISDITPGGKVSVTYNGIEVTSAAPDTSVLVTATPRAGYKFVKWDSTGTVSQPNEAVASLLVPSGEEVALTAIFEPDFDFFTERNATLPINPLSDGGPMGTHVIPDPDSPTGYTVFVIYKNHNHLEANSARDPDKRLELVDTDKIWRVRFWSNTMILIDPSNPMNANTVVQPEDFRPGLVAGGGNTYGTPRDMLNVPGTDLWYMSIPSVSGAFVYSLIVNDDFRPNWDNVTYQVDGTISTGEPNANQGMTRIDNPYDPTMVNEANGTRSLSSMIYVPYDEKMDHEWVDGVWTKVEFGNRTPASHELMPDQSRWVNRNIYLPRNGVNGMPNDGKTGTMVFHEYEVEYGVPAMNMQTGQMTGTFGAPTSTAGGGNTTPGITARNRLRTADGKDARAISVYLPYGYDADRAEPYNVIYFIMGSTSDNVGNDMRWFHEGSAQHLFDNLFADYGVEPFIAVGVDWQNLSRDVTRSSHDLNEYLIPFMETNYNVSTDRLGRAVAGMSAGGSASSSMYWYNLDTFGNLGTYAAGGTVAPAWLLNQTGTIREGLQTGGLALGDVFPGNHHAGSGIWDSAAASANFINTVNNNKLNKNGDMKALRVPGNHDWNSYKELLLDWVTTNLFDQKEYHETGVFVEEDDSSPTGYLARFVYFDETAQKVEVYSNCFNLYKIEDVDLETYQLLPGNSYGLWDYEPGMHPSNGAIGVDGEIEYYFELEKIGDTGYWTVSLPLPSGAFIYNYQITDSNGAVTRRLDDPANPTVTNPVTGVKSLSSLFYVPYKAETMGTGKWADQSLEMPRADGQTGTLDFVKYEDKYFTYSETDIYADGYRPLVVYLPYGYDADRAEPYKVLYLSHGASADQYGSELRWFNEGDVRNIMDNLVAEGEVEPFIVVTMDNNGRGRSWNYRNIMADLINELIPYIETNYNASAEVSGRAYAGFSMGGVLTNNVYFNHADYFSYFGIFGGSAATTTDLSNFKNLDKPTVVLGGGMWDFGMRTRSLGVKYMMATLDSAGIAYETLLVPGGHDWNTGQQLFTYFAKDYLWKESSVYTGYSKGVTVEKDADSPTGYTATFVYENMGDIYDTVTKVELYSDCFNLFTIEGGMTTETMYTPYQYKPGMYPAGGSGTYAFYGEMENFSGDLWGIQIPLSSGAFVYNFRLTDGSGNQASRLDDPNNPTLWNTATGVKSLSSMVYIPYDAETMGTGDWVDRSVEIPVADTTKKGTVETVAYDSPRGINTNELNQGKRGLAVYLPYDYDPDRAEPYKVLYVSHGASGDIHGNDLRWMNEGAVANIMDNLIADGTTESFVVVSMNNQDTSWNYSIIEDDHFNYLMPYIEKNYNVCTTPEGRAYAGLSMGAITTSNMFLNHAEDFSYLGVWSYGSTGNNANWEYIRSLDTKPYLMLGSGIWDFLTGAVTGMHNKLTDEGIDHAYVLVPTAHDWEAWQLLYADFVENYLWKAGKSEKLAVSVTTPTIVSTCAANLVISVEGGAGKDLTVYFKVGDELLYETDLSATNRMHITAAPAAGTYELVVMGDGCEGLCEIKVAPYNANIWTAEAYVSDNRLLVRFNTDLTLKSGTGCVTINGVSYNAKVLEDNQTVEVNADTPAKGTKISVAGVKYPDLFPSYSFTFSATVQ